MVCLQSGHCTIERHSAQMLHLQDPAEVIRTLDTWMGTALSPVIIVLRHIL